MNSRATGRRIHGFCKGVEEGGAQPRLPRGYKYEKDCSHRRMVLSSRTGPDQSEPLFTFVLMKVEALGIARSLGWKVHMRCADGYREGTKSTRRCVYTLVCTRGPNFPLSRLELRLMCAACGSRSVTACRARIQEVRR